MPPVAYGLDIETDTTQGGLDPGRCRVLAAAVATDDTVTVLTGPERSLLSDLDALLAALAAGVLVTWNGSGFDLPFLADRATVCGVVLGLRLVLDRGIVRHHPPLPGHDGSYRATWHGHDHLDAYLAYRALLAGSDQSCGLKAVARRAGLDTVDVDAGRVHELDPADLERYVASDARLALALARRRWEESLPYADGVGPSPAAGPSPAGGPSPAPAPSFAGAVPGPAASW